MLPEQPFASLVIGVRFAPVRDSVDAPYTFGRRPHVNSSLPFTTREFARLLVLRSRVQAGELHEGLTP